MGESPRKPDSYASITGALRNIVERGIPLSGIEGRTLGHMQLTALLARIEKATPQSVNPRVEKLQRIIHGNPWARWLGARIKEVRELGISGRTDCYRSAETMLRRLPTAAKTPPEFIPKPAPKEEILTEMALDNAREFIELSERPNSVASQLMDPIGLVARGLLISPKPTDSKEALNYDFTVPAALLEILKALKHPESEGVFKNWILAYFLKGESDAKSVMRFLQALVNFASFLDSPTHLELWAPPATSVQRESEVLYQPFHSLLSSVEYARHQLFRGQGKRNSLIVWELEKLEALIRLRYAEVYRGLHWTSLHTISQTALIPTPEAFSQLATSIIKTHLDSHKKHVETATSLVKLAESVGVSDMGPLISDLEKQPELQRAFIAEARRAGLIYSPEAPLEALRVLEENPWEDAADIDFSKIIKKGITNLEVYVFTGTFGPFTKGHKDLIERLLAHIDSLSPNVDEGERISQRIVLIIPVTDVSSIPKYKKRPAEIGPLEARVGSILLQFATYVDPKKVFITTRLQPDPAVARSLEGRVWDISHRLLGKISSDLGKVGRAADFRREIRFAMGPDELEWVGEHRRIAPRTRQRQKVTEPGGIMVVRRGWLLAVLRDYPAISRETGIETVVLTPGTPHSGSSMVIKELAGTGNTQAVTAAAKKFVRAHWGPEAIRSRQDNMPPSPYIPSVGEICKQLTEDLREAKS